MISLLGFGQIWWIILAGFIAIGVATGVIGSIASIRKNLSK
jgi:hypothetical protein